MQYEGLPQVYSSKYPEEELDAYIYTYLKEEIQAEALIQNQITFTMFLKVASFSNTEQLNYVQTLPAIQEFRAWLSYRRIKKELRYRRTRSGSEVDSIIIDKTAIEVKTTQKI